MELLIVPPFSWLGGLGSVSNGTGGAGPFQKAAQISGTPAILRGAPVARLVFNLPYLSAGIS